MTHLTSDELIDAMEGVVAADRQAHLAACDACRLQVDELVAVFSAAREVGVPEPSPLFWDRLSARVNEGIDTAPGSTWPQWLRWQVLLPLGAAAMVILALITAVPARPPAIDAASLQASDPLEAPADADTWVAVATLVGDIDLETASEAGVIGLGASDRAVLTLTAEEQQELTRLLKAELMRAKS